MSMNIENYNEIAKLILDIEQSQKQLKETIDLDIKLREEIKKFKEKLNSYPKKDIKIIISDMFS